MGQETAGRNIWDEKIGDLRRYDLDALEQEAINPMDIISWPVPGLTFVRIDGILRSWDIEGEKQRNQQNSQGQQDPNQIPKRMYLMEDALTGLGSQKANVCFAALGGKLGVNYYMGMSLPGVSETGNGDEEATNTAYTTLKAILNSVYNGVDIFKDPFTIDQMKNLISPLSNHVGILTGVPSLKNSGDTLESEQIERLAAGLMGHDFGIVCLAVPIPSAFVSKEEFSIVDQIQRAQENEDPEKKRRIKYYVALQDEYR